MQNAWFWVGSGGRVARYLVMLLWPVWASVGCSESRDAPQPESPSATTEVRAEAVPDREQEVGPDTPIEVSEVVERVDPHHAVVDAEKLSRYLAQVDSVSELGRLFPHRGPDGELDGYRLSGLRRGTLGQMLGFRNGDILLEVNGLPLTSHEDASRAFQALLDRESRLLDFAITRRGEPVTLRYTFGGPEDGPGKLLGE